MPPTLFEATITLGDIIGLVGPIAAVIGAYIALSTRLTRIETKVDPVWNWFVGMIHREKRSRLGDA